MRGISTTKQLEDVSRGEMRFLGDHGDHNGKYYAVDIINTNGIVSAQTSGAQVDGASNDLTGNTKEGAASHSPKVDTSVEEVQVRTQPKHSRVTWTTDKTQANINRITSAQNDTVDTSQEESQDASPKYSGSAGTLGKKVYCTYWIRTGNCNYMQEGCKYRHEIPPDDEMRLAIGVRTYPTWPREDPVCNPRPPAIKALPKPALDAPTWRRQGPQRGRTEPHVVDKQSTSTNISPASVSATADKGKIRSLPNPLTPVRTSGFHPPQSSMVNEPPKDSTVSQQQAQTHARPVLLLNPNRQNPSNPTSTGTHTHAGTYTNQRTHVAPQNQTPGFDTNPKQLSTTQSLFNAISEMAHTPSNSRAVPDQTLNQGNPFAQRLNSINLAKSNNDSQNGSPHTSEASTLPTTHRPDIHNGVQPAGLSVGGPSFPSASGPFVGRAQATQSPPYMPTHTTGDSYGGMQMKTSAVLNDPKSMQAGGQGIGTGNTSSNADSPPSANDNYNTSTTRQVNAPSAYNAEKNAGDSSSCVNTPASLSSNAHATLSNAANSIHNGTNSLHSSHQGTPAALSTTLLPGKLEGHGPSFSNPSITQTPMSIKGRGPILFTDNTQTGSNSNINTFANANANQQHLLDDALSTASSPVLHRRLFLKPGEEEFVENPPAPVQPRPQRTTKKIVNGGADARVKPHVLKRHAAGQNRAYSGSDRTSTDGGYMQESLI